MRINVPALDPERFDISHRHVPNVGPVFLINPAKAMFSLKPDELHLRSLVVRESDGEVISAGFPKFYNYGEDQTSDAIARDGFARKAISWRAKLDGTLIIRSVVGGGVYFRTRGSHELGEFADPVLKLFREKHHEWLDPRYCQKGSHLFEYVAPDNRIVLHYSEPRLWALAQVHYDGDELRLRVYDPFPPQSMDEPPRWIFGWEPAEVAREIEKMTHEEGYVAWTRLDDGSFHLSKWKTAWYKHLHSLRSEASPRFIKEYCVRHTILSLDSFKVQLAKDGFDWEFASYLEPSFTEFNTRWKSIIDLTMDFDEACAAVGVKAIVESGDRKKLALTLKEIAAKFGQDWLFHYGIMSWTGKTDAGEDLIRAQALGIGVNEFRNLKKSWAA